MLPKKSVRVGCFDYAIRLHPSTASDNHGDTNLELKLINLFFNGNEQVLKETLCHEIEHILMEDILKAVASISDDSDKEESIIRLINPRRMQAVKDNKVLFKWMWDL